MTIARDSVVNPPVTHRATSIPAGVGGNLVVPATGSLRIAGEHFAAATLYLLVGALGLVWVAPALARGDFLSPHVAGVTHFFTLGWLTMTIFGALHQLLPVALGTPIRWPRVSDVSYLMFAPGVGFFASGVAFASNVLRHVGLVLVGLGVILMVINFVAALVKTPSHDATSSAIAAALFFLTSTLVLGAVLLHNLHTGFIAAARVHVLAIHLHVAIVGWALVMIVGVSNRLLPMFLLAHGAQTSWTRRSLILLPVGLVALSFGLGGSNAIATWAGVILLELGVACFIRQVSAFYRARIRKRIDIGMRFAGVALGFLIVSSIMGAVLAARGYQATRLATAYVLAGLLGGIVIYVIGFFYKIVPLLAWTAHYQRRASKPGVPTVAELYSARVARIQLLLMPAGVAILVIAILGGSALAARAGAALFLAGVLIFVSQLIRVARGGHFGGALS